MAAQCSIHVLSAELANKIAAGEVVERPASVVKELVENSIDAGSTSITVETRDGGKEFIRVIDNGIGMSADEMQLAFLRHATSKIWTAEDLTTVGTLGFRGEALPSIASCSEVELVSRQKTRDEAMCLVVKGGKAEPLRPAPSPPGTTVTVRRLFYNTPARYKFLKTTATEKRYVADYVSHMALAHPHIAFRLVSEKGTVLSTPGKSDLLAAFAAVHGGDLARHLIPVAWDSPFVSLSGFVSPPNQNRHNRSQMSIFVNGRWVQNRLLYAAVEKGYDTMLPSRRFPAAVLHLAVDPSLIDVNVHPAKTEIRFRHESETFKNVMLAVKEAVTGANLVETARKVKPSQEQSTSSVTNLTPQQRGLQAVQRDSRPYTSSARPQLRPQYRETISFGGGSSVNEGKPQHHRVATTAGAANFTAGEIGVSLSATSETPGLREHMQEAIDTSNAVPEEAAAVREFLQNAPVLGQVLNTYLCIPAPEGLWLIDQHVAHERVLYEEVLAKPETKAAQMLLEPLSIELSATETALMEEAQAELEELGFEIEPFGGTHFLVRAVPLQLAGAPHPELVSELVGEVATAWERKGPNRKERAAAMVACKAAIKAGKRLPPMTQKALVVALSMAKNPFACPHGRPIIVAIDQNELARRFGRQ